MIATAADLAAALHAKPDGKGGWMAPCVTHNDPTPSLHIGIGEKKPIIVKCFAGCSSSVVIAELKRRGLWPGAKGGDARASRPPTGVVAPPTGVVTRARCVATYDYRDAAGAIRYREQRLEDATTGRKSYRASQPDGQGGWTYNLNDVTPLPYRLPELLARPDRVLFVAEGEKCADALGALGFRATTHHGGAGNAAVWKQIAHHLAGRNVVVLPDNDAPGEKCASIVCRYVARVASKLRVLRLPDLPDAGDIVDWLAAGHERDDLVALVKACPEWHEAPEPEIRPPQQPQEPRSLPWTAQPTHQNTTKWTPPPTPVLTPSGAETAKKPPIQDVIADRLQLLGHDHGLFYLMNHAAGQVGVLTASQICSPAGLRSLAPDKAWEAWFPSRRGFGGAGLCGKIGSALIEQLYEVGPYDPQAMRGRGAWVDQQRIVLHCGTHLVVDGEPQTGTKLPTSQYVYERGPRIAPPGGGEPITNREATALLDLLQQLRWARSLDAYLLLGWCAAGLLSGVLRWRPHIFVTGDTGTGKTTVMRDVVRRLLGSWHVACQSHTSEPGLRSQIHSDALPIVFDEADRDPRVADLSMPRILELMRQASSDSGPILKGGPASSGGGVFYVRSACALGAVDVTLTQESDLNRFSILELRKDDRPEAVTRYWDSWAPSVVALLTDEWCSRWRARVFAEARWICANAQTFARAIAATPGASQRSGDQLGTLLAGAYAVMQGGQAQPSALEGLLSAQQPAADLVAEATRSTDRPWAPLRHLLEATVEVDDGHRRVRRTIAELVRLAGRREMATDISAEVAAAVLGRHGVKCNGTGLYVSNSHRSLVVIYSGTGWHAAWSRALRRIPFAVAGGRQSFAASISSATWVPLLPEEVAADTAAIDVTGQSSLPWEPGAEG